MKFYAHTRNGPDGIPLPQNHWEPLFSSGCTTLSGLSCPHCAALARNHGHSNKVAHLTSEFAAAMFPPGTAREAAREWGRLLGLWHDLGKFAPEWQAYLASKADSHQADATGKVDHSTAGAQHAVKAHPIFGHILAYAIAGHHSGLLDVKTNGRSCQETRLSRDDLPALPALPEAIADLPIPYPPAFVLDALRSPKTGSHIVATFTRLLFSCLVDADFLATEAFMNPSATDVRNIVPPDALSRIDALVSAKIASFPTPAPHDHVNRQRATVVSDCTTAADEAPGLFTLTVPTGGGKTLSSLRFALRHALRHGHRRIIYVAPFTSIIEQNAAVIRDIVAPLASDTFTPLIEHHSALSPDRETEQSRLAAENWDAPIVVTTAVQFFESLHAAKTSRCRKLHRIADAVVILDEAQTLPVSFLAPCLRILDELTAHYHTTAVLCTATQPAVGFDAAQFPIGLKNCREIIRDPAALFAALKRVHIEDLGAQADADIARRMLLTGQSLCIVNRRRHAQELFQLLPPDSGRFHLSALMCPAHRTRRLDTIRQRLRDGLPVHLVSTQLIEAGVDIDFPVVFRALAGLDSIAQAAGRCNRHGKLPDLGQTFLFLPEDDRAETYFRETAQVAAQVIACHADLLGQEAIHHYFDLYYYRQTKRWDENGILDHFRLDGAVRHCPLRFAFRTAADNFQLIDDWQQPVIIPYDTTARKLIAELRNEFAPLSRSLLRSLQRYTVQISPKVLQANLHAFDAVRDDQFHALISTELHYSDEFGLTFDEDHTASRFLGA